MPYLYTGTVGRAYSDAEGTLSPAAGDSDGPRPPDRAQLTRNREPRTAHAFGPESSVIKSREVFPTFSLRRGPPNPVSKYIVFCGILMCVSDFWFGMFCHFL